MSYEYEFPHPAVTVDVIVFTIENDDLKVLLIERGQEPFKGEWALPGGFVDIDESLGQAAKRELKEETGISAGFLEQLYTFGQPERDPRERIITVAYFTLIPFEELSIVAGDDASDAQLHSINDLPTLAGDHAKILNVALHRAKERVSDSFYAFQVLPDTFTMYELRRVYELILGEKLDKRNFRKKVIAMNEIETTGEKRMSVRHRPAMLYRAKR